MSITLIVPCYNEESVLPYFVEEIDKIRPSLKRPLKVLFVDDGSKDGTIDLLKEYSKKEGIDYLSFSRNFGKEAAMYAGMEYADGEYIGIIDADLQDDPSLLIKMEEILDGGKDVAGTRRSQEQDNSFLHRIGSKFFYFIINKFGKHVTLDPGAKDFRLMKRQVVHAILSLTERDRFSKGIFSWVGFDKEIIEVRDRERRAGESKWSLFQYIRYGMDGIFAFSESILHLAGYIGLTLSLVGFIYALYIVIKTLAFGIDTPGFATIACLILIAGGLNLLFMGVLGEYLGRVYRESKGRPLYIVKENSLEGDYIEPYSAGRNQQDL